MYYCTYPNQILKGVMFQWLWREGGQEGGRRGASHLVQLPPQLTCSITCQSTQIIGYERDHRLVTITKDTVSSVIWKQHLLGHIRQTQSKRLRQISKCIFSRMTGQRGSKPQINPTYRFFFSSPPKERSGLYSLGGSCKRLKIALPSWKNDNKFQQDTKNMSVPSSNADSTG